MNQSRRNRARLLEALTGMLLLAALGPWSYAQEEQWLRQRSDKKCPQPPCPEPTREPLKIPPSEMKPGEKPTVTAPGAEPVLRPERFGAVGAETLALTTPNMIGASLGSSECRSVP